VEGRPSANRAITSDQEETVGRTAHARGPTFRAFDGVAFAAMPRVVAAAAPETRAVEKSASVHHCSVSLPLIMREGGDSLDGAECPARPAFKQPLYVSIPKPHVEVYLGPECQSGIASAVIVPRRTTTKGVRPKLLTDPPRYSAMGLYHPVSWA